MPVKPYWRQTIDGVLTKMVNKGQISSLSDLVVISFWSTSNQSYLVVGYPLTENKLSTVKKSSDYKGVQIKGD